MTATDKQIAFIKSLLSRKVWEHDIPDYANDRVDAGKFIADLLQAPDKPREVSGFIDKDGMYYDRDNAEIYKVQYNRASGDGRRLYAKRLVVDVMPKLDQDGAILAEAEMHFEYAPGVVNRIRPEWRMTMQEAKVFGELYGRCIRCGRVLTREVSIERSMGPVCARAFQW